jgi:hypothetical protein
MRVPVGGAECVCDDEARRHVMRALEGKTVPGKGMRAEHHPAV